MNRLKTKDHIDLKHFRNGQLVQSGSSTINNENLLRLLENPEVISRFLDAMLQALVSEYVKLGLELSENNTSAELNENHITPKESK